MDLLIYVTKGLSTVVKEGGFRQERTHAAGDFITRALFSTITNANFDKDRITALISEGRALRDRIADEDCIDRSSLDAAASWNGDIYAYADNASIAGVLSSENEDVRSLRQLLVYGLKGISAYTHHAAVLGFEDAMLYKFICEALDSTLRELSTDEMVSWVMRAGEYSVTAMALLDKANTSTYGES